MTLSEQIENEYIDAYKAKDSVKLSVLRLLKTAIKNRLVELKQPGGALADDALLEVIIKQAKQRQDSIEQYNLAGRADLAEKEKAELLVLQAYLPEAITGDKLKEIINAVISKLQASSPKDMGKVIGKIMADYKGQVDGKEVSETVRAVLSSGS